MYQFRDPIHGFIEVSEDERQIIDSGPLQRLRNIRQLATTYLVYHGAEHTRFGHSLGVMHLTSRAFDMVCQKVPFLFSEDEIENKTKTQWYRQILRLIGLTHDLGHAPFSHASEALFEDKLQHEDYTKKILLDSEVSVLIQRIGEKFAEKHGEQYLITPKLVWMVYEGKEIRNPAYIMPDFKFLQSFVDSELDCDKMDYLLRDSLYCGVSYGTYDLERFLSTLTAHKKCGVLQLAIEKGGVQALEEFILARYFMFIQVYFHKTRRYLDKCLIHCLQEILPNGKYPRDISDYMKWNDNAVLQAIAGSKSSVANTFGKRQIKPCVYESTAHATSSEVSNFTMVFNMLSKELGQGTLMEDRIDKAAHKLTPRILPHDDDSGKGIHIIDNKTGEVEDLMEASLLLDSIVKPISIRRIYVPKESEARALTFLKEIKSGG